CAGFNRNRKVPIVDRCARAAPMCSMVAVMCCLPDPWLLDVLLATVRFRVRMDVGRGEQVHHAQQSMRLAPTITDLRT
ncbi:MAG: hypothetical protein ACRDT5_08945, partial [Mycobacterium sp.]